MKGFIRGLVSLCLEDCKTELADSLGMKKENVKDLKDKVECARKNDGPRNVFATELTSFGRCYPCRFGTSLRAQPKYSSSMRAQP